jgi:hypothetical protein
MIAKLQMVESSGGVDRAVVRRRVVFLPGEISPEARKDHAERRSEKSAEAVVAAGDRGEGPNEEESEPPCASEANGRRCRGNSSYR